ncbi:hypothetical protein B0I21_103484 [Sphingobacterium paludis]|uniref:Uncharacterized protein n=1 Tax=Sphingobacterium paludis TaxID=1476465 RepID=A0A4R7D3U0_9SPHI|nr:hypothetical protein B0I21_103484 [Sphingobacterium paludis]
MIISLKELLSPPRRALASYISWHRCPNYLFCFPPFRWDCKGRRFFRIRKIKLNFFFAALKGKNRRKTPYIQAFPSPRVRFSIVPPLRSGAKIELWHDPCKQYPLISCQNPARHWGSVGYFYRARCRTILAVDYLGQHQTIAQLPYLLWQGQVHEELLY